MLLSSWTEAAHCVNFLMPVTLNALESARLNQTDSTSKLFISYVNHYLITFDEFIICTSTSLYNDL